MKRGFYIHMYSMHGLIRPENPELGRDADTGGQVKYVIELGKQLSRLDRVRRVDLFTRLIADKSVSNDYSRPVEEVNDRFRIVRIQCGGRKYIRKELLWPHLDEYIDKTIKFIKQHEAIPDFVHGHYADAGYVAMQLGKIFGVPFVFTGHSLGRAKKQKLLAEGMREDEIEKKYKINHRVLVEEELLKHADLIVTSTQQEIDDQYGMYRHRRLPVFRVIPPGLDLDRFHPFSHIVMPEFQKNELTIFARASMLQELNRFFIQPEKPLILALCRPDKRKNISGLVSAYGQDPEIRAIANLAVFAGIRKDITHMEDNEKDVLTEMLLLMDKYDLYGRMAIPKKHDVEYEVPELYRIAAEKRGVFVNVALTEPFGLTLLEAAACGLPIVATNDGGPIEIVKRCGNGILVDPSDTQKIAAAIKSILTDPDTWSQFSKNGIVRVKHHYSWINHADKYIEALTSLSSDGKREAIPVAAPYSTVGKRLAAINWFVITDIDNTLTGEENSRLNELLRLIEENRERIAFGVATGRTIDSALRHLKEHGITRLDAVVSSVGTEIYYGEQVQQDLGWQSHIQDKWNREKIVDLLKRFDFLTYQPPEAQRKYKISYNMEPVKDRQAVIHDLLLKNRLRYTLVYSHEKFLDILPYRASKGKAVRYLSYKWEIPLANFLVCGDSGNDEEMMRGDPLAVVVGNYSPEIENLKGARNVYFARAPRAAGILEGIRHYGFIERSRG